MFEVVCERVVLCCVAKYSVSSYCAITTCFAECLCVCVFFFLSRLDLT